MANGKDDIGPVVLPDDIKPGMLNVIRRLQSVSKTEGCSVVTIRVAFGPDGNPICWSQPVVVRLEPKGSCFVDELLELLTQGC